MTLEEALSIIYKEAVETYDRHYGNQTPPPPAPKPPKPKTKKKSKEIS